MPLSLNGVGRPKTMACLSIFTVAGTVAATVGSALGLNSTSSGRPKNSKVLAPTLWGPGFLSGAPLRGVGLSETSSRAPSKALPPGLLALPGAWKRWFRA